jgi:hypothetical protein
MEEEIPIPDPPLSPDQEALVAQLTSEQIEEIDAVLMSNAKPRWRKVAMLVGLSIGQLQDKIEDIPDLYYSQRVRKLVESGRLETQGNFAYMRFSEVRLPEIQHNET